jgi:hypothetical protein
MVVHSDNNKYVYVYGQRTSKIVTTKRKPESSVVVMGVLD